MTKETSLLENMVKKENRGFKNLCLFHPSQLNRMMMMNDDEEPPIVLDNPQPKNRRYDKRDFIARKHGKERESWVQKPMPFPPNPSKKR